MKLLILITSVLLLSGCATTPHPDSAAARLRSDIDKRAFHRGFLEYPSAQRELRDIGEGALNYEYSLLMERTADTGQDEWASIFEDRSIPVETKIDLVRMIDMTYSGAEKRAVDVPIKAR